MKLMCETLLDLLKITNDIEFRVVEKPEFRCIEYDIRLNLFTFSKFFIPLKITVIGPPISLCQKGFAGDINALIRYYKNQKGIFLVLNDDEPLKNEPERSGHTLSNCIFKNRFNSFDEYLKNLRSPYRRRISLALKKGQNLKIEKTEKINFSDEMYKLYLNVVNKSKYRLETLKKEFFKEFDGEIYAFFNNDKPLAFVLLKKQDKKLFFIFGGMDYKNRDAFDLYYNMLIFIVKKGIDEKCELIDFGQTAESTKVRIGCVLQEKFFHVCSGNKFVDFILVKLLKFLEYKYEQKTLRVFKNVE